MQSIRHWLSLLSQTIAVSGDEQGAASLMEKIKPLCDRVWRNADGSVVLFKKSARPGAPKIMMDAHLDEVGLMVNKIDADGFVHFINHAGVDAKILPGTRVHVLGKQPLVGVVAAKPPHLLSKEEREKPIKMKEMVIDVGLTEDQAKNIVRVGDAIAYDSVYMPLLSNCVTGKSLDNRAGMAVLLSLLEVQQNRSFFADLYITFSSGEEFGGYGATALTREIAPDMAIVLDVSHADMPGADVASCGKLGKGVMIGISPVLDKGLSDRFLQLARQNKISYQTEAMSSRTSTNADSIVPLCGGIPTALLSIPLRYMHTTVETLKLDVIRDAGRLMAMMIVEMAEGWEGFEWF